MPHPPSTAALKALRDRPTLTVTEAAALLGIGRNTAYAAVRAGELPAFRLGGRVLIPTARLLALLEGGNA